MDSADGRGCVRDADLELGAFTAAPLPADAKPQVTVTQLDLDQVSGRFSAMLEVAADDVPSTQLRVTGRVQEMIDLPVARRRIMPGEVIATEDLEWAAPAHYPCPRRVRPRARRGGRPRR